jgi:hypothetical protein
MGIRFMLVKTFPGISCSDVLAGKEEAGKKRK